ncbi:FAD-binding oxidoreductase [Siculibacillus lacustris]|uniref:FAD-binding oxidoreductase n=1 Tax=Siculibacillus lacustris TaxID=1549641 RepID=A0A4Q9VWP6_9HYPH|nr:FAD-binding oxidoreductase [Siculibacillus lacustris]TBW39525.1 FAD-binding oxidoreductase [Siculibacillus lacustris]
MVERLDVDVAIVGGGTAACAAAVALRGHGLTVAVLEKRRCGAGASGVNFGGVRQQGRDLRELPLARRSRTLWDGLSALLGEDVEFEVSGHIKLARSEADLADLEAYRLAAQEYGLELTMLGANAVHAELPWLGEKVLGASLSPTDGQANPRVVGPAYARLARRLGAEIREFTPVTGAVATGRGFEIEAQGLTVTARHLINAAGAGGGLLATAFGETVPVTPLSPNMLVTEPLPYFISRSIGVCGGDVYIRQTRRGNAIFGGGHGWQDVELGFGRPTAEQSLDGMRRTLQLVPSLAQANVIRTWSGFDGQMPDHIPVIGPSATTPGLIHAFGFSGHGFQLGPVIGLILAELVTDGRTPSPIEPFAITRFRDMPTATSAEAAHTEH